LFHHWHLLLFRHVNAGRRKLEQEETERTENGKRKTPLPLFPPVQNPIFPFPKRQVFSANVTPLGAFLCVLCVLLWLNQPKDLKSTALLFRGYGENGED
jgi:hypothetical protein